MERCHLPKCMSAAQGPKAVQFVHRRFCVEVRYQLTGGTIEAERWRSKRISSSPLVSRLPGSLGSEHEFNYVVELGLPDWRYSNNASVTIVAKIQYWGTLFSARQIRKFGLFWRCYRLRIVSHLSPSSPSPTLPTTQWLRGRCPRRSRDDCSRRHAPRVYLFDPSHVQHRRHEP